MRSLATFILTGFIFQSLLVAQEPSGELPSSTQVIEAFVEALGGEMAIEGVGEFELKGTITDAPQAGVFRSLCADGKLVSRMEYDGLAIVDQGSDGGPNSGESGYPRFLLWHSASRPLVDAATLRRFCF